MSDELIRIVVQVVCGMYLAFTAGWRLNRLTGTLSTTLVAGYVLLGAGSFLIAMHPFTGSLMNWGELTFLIGVVLITLPFGNIWRHATLVEFLNRGLFSVQSSNITSHKGVLFLSILLAVMLFGVDRFFGVLGGPPIRIVSAVPETTVLRYGEPLRLTYTIRRFYSCPATIYDSFLPIDNNTALVRLTPIPAGFSSIGLSKILRVIKTTGTDVSGDHFNLTPGEYLFTSFSTHRCKAEGHDHMQETTVYTPEIRIRIENQFFDPIQQ